MKNCCCEYDDGDPMNWYLCAMHMKQAGDFAAYHFYDIGGAKWWQFWKHYGVEDMRYGLRRVRASAEMMEAHGLSWGAGTPR